MAGVLVGWMGQTLALLLVMVVKVPVRVESRTRPPLKSAG
jgi:hypothetical protein